MNHLPLPELIQYVEEHVEDKAMTIEYYHVPTDREPDLEPTILDFSSKDEFFTYCTDLAGTLTIMTLMEIRARIL